MRKQYRNPPLIEALCEFQFTPESSYDLTIPGKLHANLITQYPRIKQGKVLAVEMAGVAETLEQKVHSVDRIHFLSEDERRLVQVGPRLFVVNMLKPYSNWEDFREHILSGYREYSAIARPKGISRIELRYINRIGINVSSIKFEDYFRFSPLAQDPLPQEFSAFVIGIQALARDGKDLLHINMTSLPPENDASLSFSLDIRYGSNNADSTEVEKVSEWLGLAHDVVGQTFEACITNTLRSLFEEVS